MYDDIAKDLYFVYISCIKHFIASKKEIFNNTRLTALSPIKSSYLNVNPYSI